MNGSMASACATSSWPLASARFARRRTVACRATGSGGGRGDNNGLLWLPRRDVMLNGLSGVAAGLAWYPGLADAAECTRADKVNENTIQCTDTEGASPCPLVSATAAVVDFTPASKVTRVRQAAHLLNRENQEKYKEAVGKMKALPASNPLSFTAQAAIHQAYCDSYYKYHKAAGAGAGAGTAVSKDDPVFDVHFSWIFAPWHRMYIYFYERALGQLIGDDTFALPFWSWDAPAGMVVPPLFTEGSTAGNNPLYDANRNPANLDALIDLDYLNDMDADPIPFNGPKDQEYKKLVNKNLSTVYNQQVGKGAESFLGEKYCTDIGSSTTSMGSLERMAHTAVHVWVGKAGPTPATATCSEATGGVANHSMPGEYTCNNDMGFLGTAGRDPLFYSHHSNVDRMWHLWSTRLGGGHGVTDTDWLDASFVFYDGVESPRKVRVRFRDVLDTRDLGYTYDPEYDKDLPWLRPKITSLVPHGEDSGVAARSAAAVLFPLTLTKGKVVEVPGVAVPAREAGKEQLLVINGIEFDPQANNKFDVAINVPKDKAVQVGPQHKEYAGSFAVVPGSGAVAGGTRQGKVSLGITDVLYDIDAEDDSTVDVVIVPRTAAKVTLNVRPAIKNRN